jgi:hypothetical protein
MTKIIRDYVGTASHLYWLITSKIHPKEIRLDSLNDNWYDNYIWNSMMQVQNGITKIINGDGDEKTEGDEEDEKIEENEDFQLNQ